MTISVDAPPRNLYDVGNWLCQRHPDLMTLCGKVGAVIAGKVDTVLVRTCVTSYDEFHNARAEYNRRNGLAPHHETPESMSITLGPQPAPCMLSMLTMHPSQIAALRLVATMAPQLYGSPNVEWCVDSLITVPPAVVRDWFEAMERYVTP